MSSQMHFMDNEVRTKALFLPAYFTK